MHISVNFYLKFVRTHNTVSHAQIAQSTELYQRVKKYVLATLKRDELVFWTPHFSVLTPHFGWAPPLKLWPKRHRTPLPQTARPVVTE